jgi:hypothetical protein
MVNLVVRLSIRKCPSKFMNVTVWEHRTSDNKIFGCGKVYYSSFIIITKKGIVCLKFIKYLIIKMEAQCISYDFGGELMSLR